MTEDRAKLDLTLKIENLTKELERLAEENNNIKILNKSLVDDLVDLKRDNKLLATQVTDLLTKTKGAGQ
jgi:regulator of replication initiation timing